MVSSVGMSGIQPPMMRHPPPSFEDLDTNGDGAISVDEIQSAGKNLPGGKSGSLDRANAFLKKLDTNGDGTVSKDELTAFQSNIAAQMQSAMLQVQEQQGHHGHGHGGKGAESADQSFDALDTNHDGVVSADELAAGTGGAGGVSDVLTKLMSAIDQNKDGAASKDEVKSFMDLVTQTFGSKSGGNAQARTAANCYSSAASLLDEAPGTETSQAA